MGYIFHPYGRIIVDLRVLINQFPAHNRNIPGCGHVLRRIRQAAAVHKIRSRHSKACGTLIHHPYKFPFAPGYVLRHGHGRVISRGNDNALDQRFYCLDFPFLQKYLGAAHGFCIGTCNHFIRELDPSFRQSVKNKDQRHNLCDAGRRTLLIRPLFKNNLACGGFHQNSAGGRDRQGRPLGRGLCSHSLLCRHCQSSRRYGDLRLLCPDPCSRPGKHQHARTQ